MKARWPVLVFPTELASRITEVHVSSQPKASPAQSAATFVSRTDPRFATSSAPARGDFDQIYTAHFHHVSRWARALGCREADLEDVAQDVFLVVRRKLTGFSGPSLNAWLYGITRRTVSDYRRRAWLRRLRTGFLRSIETTAESEMTPTRDASGGLEARRILVHVLGKMSDVRRTAFVLFEVEGYSGEEIAELEQIPLATVYTRLHHARRDFLRFTAELTGHEVEEPPL